jgi:hypothetical protein
MSRSVKKPIVKDKPSTRLYWRTTRRVINQKVRYGDEDLPSERSIVNDYDYSDYMFISDLEKSKRK